MTSIKRNLDKEYSDATKKIHEDLKNDVPFYSTEVGQSRLLEQKKEATKQISMRKSSNSVLESIRTIKLPKYNIKVGLTGSSNDRIPLAKAAAIANAYRLPTTANAKTQSQSRADRAQLRHRLASSSLE